MYSRALSLWQFICAETRATTAVEDDAISWLTGPIQLEMTRRIRKDERAFAKFVRDAKRYSGVVNVFGPGLEA